MPNVRPKKSLGQHFLQDSNIARKIADALGVVPEQMPVLELGPGTGILTRELIPRYQDRLWVIDIDRESVAWLNGHFPELEGRIISGDFLRYSFDELFPEPFALIGNFPYNISSQILFRMLEMRNRVPLAAGMFQKEMARRITAPPGKKDYGIISVLLQAWYDINYLFEVPPHVFYPPPKVQSAVISLRRNKVETLGCDEQFFVRVVKAGFNQRRKTLRNALKPVCNQGSDLSPAIFDRRAETLSVDEFIELTNRLRTG